MESERKNTLFKPARKSGEQPNQLRMNAIINPIF